jgi:hypothetical protein
VKGAEVRSAFNDAGVRSVLLKGPAFARLLYPNARSRDYTDVDLLVDPARLETAEEVLRRLGFERFDPESAKPTPRSGERSAFRAHRTPQRGRARGTAYSSTCTTPSHNAAHRQRSSGTLSASTSSPRR